MDMGNMMYLMFGPGRNISGKKFGQMFFWQCLKCPKHRCPMANVQCPMCACLIPPHRRHSIMLTHIYSVENVSLTNMTTYINVHPA